MLSYLCYEDKQIILSCSCWLTKNQKQEIVMWTNMSNYLSIYEQTPFAGEIYELIFAIVQLIFYSRYLAKPSFLNALSFI